MEQRLLPSGKAKESLTHDPISLIVKPMLDNFAMRLKHELGYRKYSCIS